MSPVRLHIKRVCSCAFHTPSREHVEMLLVVVVVVFFLFCTHAKNNNTTTNDIEFICSLLLSNSCFIDFDVGLCCCCCCCCCSIVLTSVFNRSVSQYDCKNNTQFLFLFQFFFSLTVSLLHFLNGFSLPCRSSRLQCR